MANSDNGPVDARTVASQLDATDGVILDMLEKDGRATLSHLSEATGLSVSAVQSRVQKLERRGVIRGYKAVIDDERRGLAVNAYIAVTPIDYSQEAEIPDKLKNIDGIMSCDSVAGSPSFMLTVRVESPSKLEELLNLTSIARCRSAPKPPSCCSVTSRSDRCSADAAVGCAVGLYP